MNSKMPINTHQFQFSDLQIENWKGNLNETRNIGLSHPDIVPIAVADVAWNIFSFVVSVKGIVFSTKGSDWLGGEHGAQLKHQNDLTYEVRIVSVESDEEAEQVTERHDKFQELIESKNLQKVEKDLYHQFSIIEMGSRW